MTTPTPKVTYKVNYTPYFVVLGGPQPGIRWHCVSPFVTSGVNAPPFPLVVQCMSHEDALVVETIQPYVETYLAQTQDPGRLVDLFYNTPLLSSVNIGTAKGPFYAVYNSERVGIFTDWIVADKHYSGSQFQSCKKFSTFRGAFCYMISKQRMVNGDNAPGFEAQVVYAEDLSGVETPLATSNRRNKEAMAMNAHAPKFSPATSSISFSSFSSALTISSPTSSTEMPVTPKLPKRMTPSRLARPLPDRLHRFQQKQEPSSSFNLEGGPLIQAQEVAGSRISHNVRALDGVVSSVPSGSLSPTSVASVDLTVFGPFIKAYLTSHGYVSEAINFLSASYSIASQKSDFVDILSSRGMAEKEAAWIWDWANE